MSSILIKPPILQRKQYINLLFSCVLIICSAVYAAGQASGAWTSTLYKSTDGGNNWAASNTGIATRCIHALAIDPVNPEILYAGCREGIFKSTDGGSTWIVPNIDLRRFDIEAIAINPVKPSILYAGTYGGGVYKSTDAGITWRPISNGLPVKKVIRRIVIHPINPSILYLGAGDDNLSDASIFKSNNGGGNWKLVLKLPLTGDGLFGVDLILDPRNPSTVYVIGSNRIFKSTDGGNNWKDITAQIRFSQSIALASSNPSTLYVRSVSEIGELFKSTDGGSNWTGITLNTPLPDHHDYAVQQLAIDPISSSTLYAVVPKQGVFKSTDGGSNWAEMGLSKNNGFPEFFIVLAINPINPSTIYAGGLDVVSPHDSPWIGSVEVSGKKLIITGGRFDNGAAILLDGNPQKTKNDADSPDSILVSENVGKKVKSNPQIKIQIINANGKLSPTVLRPVD